MAENELWGHERGAYTGATHAEPGLIDAAEGGTLFLDEIEALVARIQAALLRFVQFGEYRRFGSTVCRYANVRLICATNIPLGQEQSFRQDLLHRIGVLCLEVPPLRNRREDIPLIANHLVLRFAATLRANLSNLSQLQGHLQASWLPR